MFASISFEGYNYWKKSAAPIQHSKRIMEHFRWSENRGDIVDSETSQIFELSNGVGHLR